MNNLNDGYIGACNMPPRGIILVKTGLRAEERLSERKLLKVKGNDLMVVGVRVALRII